MSNTEAAILEALAHFKGPFLTDGLNHVKHGKVLADAFGAAIAERDALRKEWENQKASIEIMGREMASLRGDRDALELGYALMKKERDEIRQGDANYLADVAKVSEKIAKEKADLKEAAVHFSGLVAGLQDKLSEETTRRAAEARDCDAEMLRVKACEHIAEGEPGWEKLRDLCPSTTAVASLRDAFVGEEHHSKDLYEIGLRYKREKFELIAAIKAMGHDVENCSRLNAELGKTEPCDCPYKILETIK